MRGFLQKIMKKSNTWNIRHLAYETIVPSTQHIILKIVGFFHAFPAPLGTSAFLVESKVEHPTRPLRNTVLQKEPLKNKFSYDIV